MAAVVVSVLSVTDVQAQQAFGRQWGHNYSTQDWNRMYHYPYVYYPQNFWGRDYYRSSDDMYYRYPPEMRIPVYHKQWESFYPEHRKDSYWKEYQFSPMFWRRTSHRGQVHSRPSLHRRRVLGRLVLGSSIHRWGGSSTATPSR